MYVVLVFGGVDVFVVVLGDDSIVWLIWMLCVLLVVFVGVMLVMVGVVL